MTQECFGAGPPNARALRAMALKAALAALTTLLATSEAAPSTYRLPAERYGPSSNGGALFSSSLELLRRAGAARPVVHPVRRAGWFAKEVKKPPAGGKKPHIAFILFVSALSRRFALGTLPAPYSWPCGCACAG